MMKIHGSGISGHLTRTEFPQQAVFERHCHECCELLYILSGKGKIMVEAAEYPMEPGTLLLFRPLEHHYVVPEADCPYERIVCSFSAEALPEPVGRLSVLGPASVSCGVYLASPEQPELLRSALSLLRHAFTLPPDLRGPSVLSSLTQITLLLHSLLPEAGASAENSFMVHALAYLNEHLTEKLSLDEIAGQLYVSKYYFCRVFRRHTGLSVFGYLEEKRIAKAQMLLAAHIPAGEAAEQVGFRDYSSFYRAFKRQTGRSPQDRSASGPKNTK